MNIRKNRALFLSFIFIVLLFLAGCSASGDITIPGTEPDSPAKLTEPHIRINTAKSPVKGELLLSIYSWIGKQSLTKLIIMDENGNIKKLKEIPTNGLNFTRWENNNTIRYTYISPDSMVILDRDLNEVKRVRMLKSKYLATDFKPDVHDSIYFSDNHYMLVAYYPVDTTALNPSDPRGKIVTAVIQEIKDDAVIWEWSSINFPELSAASKENVPYHPDPAYNDDLHLNSFAIDPNDYGIVMSLRNIDGVVKIDKKSGAIMWILGGDLDQFGLASHMKFLRQHHALILDNSTLTLFDNGNDSRPYSRMLEYKIDFLSKKIIDFKEILIKKPDENVYYSKYMGSVQKYGRFYLGAYPMAGHYFEYDSYKGEVTFDLELITPPEFMPDSPLVAYRIFKYPVK